ncbi:unnamed protein product [Meganyctiphanes norvegica]|uniref:RING-type domain-containing protein n=1 Tax=Meganyctiphanes norvegica TaxID=48144 RepID=A0AAV2Q432_MEGNR
MDSILECEVCLQHFNYGVKRPRFLVCGHTICSECISESLSNTKSNDGTLACPFCRMSCGVDKKETKDFPTNYKVLNIMKPHTTDAEASKYKKELQDSLHELSSMKSSAVEVTVSQIEACKDHLDQNQSLLQQLQVEKEIFNQKKTGILKELQTVEAQEAKHMKKLHNLQVSMVKGENILLRLVRMKHCIQSAGTTQEVRVVNQDAESLYHTLRQWSGIVKSPRYVGTRKLLVVDEMPETQVSQQNIEILPIANGGSQTSYGPSLKRWKAMVNGGPQRAWHAAAAVDNKIYIFGGDCQNNNSCQTDQIDVHIFDCEHYTWTTLENSQNSDTVPCRRWGHSAVAYENNVYVWGGRNEETFCNILYCFVTKTNSWTKPDIIGHPPSARWKHSACVINNCMYIFSGSSDKQDLYVFDFKKMSWDIIQSNGEPPSARVYHTAVAIDNIMYVWGGRKPLSPTSEAYSPIVYAFDPKTNNWSHITVTGSTPIARRSHSAFTHDNHMFIYGGWNQNKNKNLDDLWSFDPRTSEWQEMQQSSPAPDSIEGHVSCVVETRMFLHGGGDREAGRKDELYNQAMWILDLT